MRNLVVRGRDRRTDEAAPPTRHWAKRIRPSQPPPDRPTSSTPWTGTTGPSSTSCCNTQWACQIAKADPSPPEVARSRPIRGASTQRRTRRQQPPGSRLRQRPTPNANHRLITNDLRNDDHWCYIPLYEPYHTAPARGLRGATGLGGRRAATDADYRRSAPQSSGRTRLRIEHAIASPTRRTIRNDRCNRRSR
jgi:hypothetical protein